MAGPPDGCGPSIRPLSRFRRNPPSRLPAPGPAPSRGNDLLPLASLYAARPPLAESTSSPTHSPSGFSLVLSWRVLAGRGRGPVEGRGHRRAGQIFPPRPARLSGVRPEAGGCYGPSEVAVRTESEKVGPTTGPGDQVRQRCRVHLGGHMAALCVSFPPPHAPASPAPALSSSLNSCLSFPLFLSLCFSGTLFVRVRGRNSGSVLPPTPVVGRLSGTSVHHPTMGFLMDSAPSTLQGARS